MSRVRTITVLVGVTLLAVALGGCSAAAPPDTTPMLRGVIVSLTPVDEGGVVRVVWHESVGALGELDSCDVTIGSDTDVFGEGGAPLTFADLAERDIVDVWISGAIAESYPPQATADAVQFVGEFDASLPLPTPLGFVEPE